METRDPNLTKTKIDNINNHNERRTEVHEVHDGHPQAHVENPITDTMQETVIGSGYLEPNELQETLAGDHLGHSVNHHDHEAHLTSVDHNQAPLHESRAEELSNLQGQNHAHDVKTTDTMQETVISSDRLGGTAIDDNVLRDASLADSGVPHLHNSEQNIARSEAATVAELESRRPSLNTADETAINERDIQAHTTVENGTQTFDSQVMQTEHVNPGDNPAREPDRRDQEGSPFDDNVNEETTGTEIPKSEFIDDHNRYASVENAQSRVLPTEDKGDDRSYDRYNE